MTAVRPAEAEAGEAPLRLDAALETLLAQPLEGVARTELEAFRDALARRAGAAPTLDPPGLVGVIFDAIMPRLPDPGLLRLGRRRRLLHSLAARLEALPGSPEAARGDLLAVRRELRALALLHHNRDSLIEA